jgi:polysaccharide export outer membrane protein
MCLACIKCVFLHHIKLFNIIFPYIVLPMNKDFILIRSCLLLLVIGLFFSSCGTTKNVPYFKNVADSGLSILPVEEEFKEPLIQADDLLSISIFTIDPLTSMVVNQLSSQNVGNSISSVSTPNLITQGFLVNKNGDIQIPVIGKINLKGMTTSEARDVIEKIAYKT